MVNRITGTNLRNRCAGRNSDEGLGGVLREMAGVDPISDLPRIRSQASPYFVEDEGKYKFCRENVLAKEGCQASK